MTDSYGLSLCLRYAYPPNSLYYCGPEKQAEAKGYLTAGITDGGLSEILSRFETLYPYLTLIAGYNHIADPFNRRVIGAYWLGNTLLKKVPPNSFYLHLKDTLQISRKTTDRGKIEYDKFIGQGFPNHTFHVLNIFTRTGHLTEKQTLATMDNCRISWGRVRGGVLKSRKRTDKSENIMTVETRPLLIENHKLCIGVPEIKEVVCLLPTVKSGDWVSLHWGYICDAISPVQKKQLINYTNLALNIANRHIHLA